MPACALISLYVSIPVWCFDTSTMWRDVVSAFNRETNCETKLKFTYTAMHGVGFEFIEEAFKRFNFPPCIPVKQQVARARTYPHDLYCMGCRIMTDHPMLRHHLLDFTGQTGSRVSHCEISQSRGRQKCTCELNISFYISKNAYICVHVLHVCFMHL